MLQNSMKFSIFSIFLSLIVSLCQSLAIVRCHLDNFTDQTALLSFKSQVTSDPNQVLQTWNKSSPICKWHGVICNNKKTRVTGLALQNLTLAGTISPQITNLSFLRILDLENNSFHGMIPLEVGKLFRLETLILASNNIHGLIPSSLGDCSRLQLIDLSRNRLEGAIPYEIGNLMVLQDLSFANNNLTGFIPTSFGNLSSLNNLVLKSNYLQGPIPNELGRLSLLLQLHVADNSISGEIPSSLFNLSSLVILSLSKNNLSGYLPSNLFTMLPNLTTLFVGGNTFQGELPSSLSNTTNLERVDFSTNAFTGKVPLLWNLQNIIILNLEINQLSSDGEDGLDFITSLNNSTLLQVFSVATNQFSGKLPSSIGNLSSQLALLVMAENHFEGNIPESVGNLGGLILLSMEFNSLTGKIPSSIGNLQNLQNLFLYLNFLSGSIPESLGNLTQLYELGLNDNNLTGTIPSSLSNCQHIQSLDLSMNNLSGKIPKEIFGFPNLGTLMNVSQNSLTGPLPSEVGSLRMVQGIDISRNKLSGAIPPTLGQCSNVLYLDLSNNLFEGPIPSSLSNLKGVEYIDLSANNLSGSVPNSLGNLQYLKLLNLSANELQGEVPKLGIFLNASGFVVSGDSGLCGGISDLGLSKCTTIKSHSHKSRKILTMAVSTSAAACALIVLSILVLFKKRKAQQGSFDVISFDGPRKLYSYYNLKKSTNNFSPDNLIGKGSFGFVYKCTLGNGSMAAVKVFDMDQSGASKSFIAECEALKNIRHRNLVKILSACSTPSFKALVVQFMPNGSLEGWIHHDPENSRLRLDLKQRIKIAMDVASAMEYLHHDCKSPVVHCDLKPSNVLLDQDMTAHVADFGLARILHGTTSADQISSTLGLKGSIGYIAQGKLLHLSFMPSTAITFHGNTMHFNQTELYITFTFPSVEYGSGGEVSTKGDVYSFGILLLEMLTGKRPTEERFDGEFNLQKWVQAAIPNGVLKIMDDEVMDDCKVLNEEHLVSALEIGLSCAMETPETRPVMKDVSSMLRRTWNIISSDATQISKEHSHISINSSMDRDVYLQ